MGAVKAKAGNTKVSIDDTLDKMVEKVIKSALPEFDKAINQGIKEIYENAKNNWLVRPKNSRGSIDKLDFSVKVQGGRVIGEIRNLAPYAWAIKVGGASDTYLPLNTRIADYLLFKPMKRLATKLGKRLADDLINLQKVK